MKSKLNLFKIKAHNCRKIQKNPRKYKIKKSRKNKHLLLKHQQVIEKKKFFNKLKLVPDRKIKLTSRDLILLHNKRKDLNNRSAQSHYPDQLIKYCIQPSRKKFMRQIRIQIQQTQPKSQSTNEC